MKPETIERMRNIMKERGWDKSLSPLQLSMTLSAEIYSIIERFNDDENADIKDELPALYFYYRYMIEKYNLDEDELLNTKMDEYEALNPPYQQPVVGDRIRIIHLEAEDDSYKGKEYIVERVDELGQLFGGWGDFPIIPGIDAFEIK